MISKRRNYRGGSVRPCYMEAYTHRHTSTPHKSGNKKKRKKKKHISNWELGNHYYGLVNVKTKDYLLPPSGCE